MNYSLHLVAKTTNMRSALLFSILLLVCIAAYGQAPIQWAVSPGGTASDAAYSVRQTFDTGYIVAGYTASTDGDVTVSTGTVDYWVVKLHSDGTIDWQATYGGTGQDEANAIIQTADTGYIVAGYTSSTNGDVTGNHGGFDVWVVKLSKTGAIQWEHCYGGAGNEYGTSIQQTSDGGYIIAAYSNMNGGDVTGIHSSSNDYWIIKINATGGLVWETAIGGSGDDEATGIKETMDGNFIVSGFSNSTDGDVTGNHGSYDYWIAELSATGSLVWEQCYGGTGQDKANAIIQCYDSSYTVAGNSFSDDGDVTGHHGGTSSSDAWIINVSTGGTLNWGNSFGSTGAEVANAIWQTADSNFIAACGTNGAINGDVTYNHGYREDFWITKISGTGSLMWQRSYGGANDDEAYAIQQTNDLGYIVAGYNTSGDGDVTGHHGPASSTSMVPDMWVVKLSAMTYINGDTILCTGTTDTLSDGFGGGTWTSADPAIAAVDATSGIVTCGTTGTTTITYVCAAGMVSTSFIVDSLRDPGIISGDTTVCITSSITLSDTATGGTWSCTNGNGTISAGVFTGVTGGTDTVIYTVSNHCGSTAATFIVTVNACTTGITATSGYNTGLALQPNPAQNECTVSYAGTITEGATISICDMAGRILIVHTLQQHDTMLSLSGLADGIYICRINNGGTMISSKLVVMHQ
jgi:Secretion system C-terminal sorting domain